MRAPAEIWSTRRTGIGALDRERSATMRQGGLRFAKRRSPICETPVLNFEEIGFGLAEAFRTTFVFIVFFSHNAHGAGLATSPPRALEAPVETDGAFDDYLRDGGLRFRLPRRSRRSVRQQYSALARLRFPLGPRRQQSVERCVVRVGTLEG